jgi:hypothetical protein
MDVEHWLARALGYSLDAGRSRAVARATGSRRDARRADLQRGMSNGFLEVGFRQIAATSRGEEPAAASAQPAEGGSASEQDEG